MTIINIFKKIYIHPSCYIFLGLSFLAGYFNISIFISIILLIHELGHFLAACFFKFSPSKIVFYPFGGISKFNHDINCPLKDELIVLLAGPLLQIICYFLIRNMPYFYSYKEILTTINYSIILFNLLPIYPLDGGKIMQVFLCYLTSYQLSFKIIYFISYIFLSLIIISFIINPTINILLVIILLILKLLTEKRKIKYYLEKFYLERYLHKYNFKKGKVINNSKDFKRDYHHIIKEKNRYLLESDYLKMKYKNKI